MPSHHCVLNSVAECREEPGSPPHTLQCLPTLPPPPEVDGRAWRALSALPSVCVCVCVCVSLCLCKMRPRLLYIIQ